MVLTDRNNPLHWQCPKCGADPHQECYVVVAGGKIKLNHDYGTHIQRTRLALFFDHNPNVQFDGVVWKFATEERE